MIFLDSAPFSGHTSPPVWTQPEGDLCDVHREETGPTTDRRDRPQILQINPAPFNAGHTGSAAHHPPHSGGGQGPAILALLNSISLVGDSGSECARDGITIHSYCSPAGATQAP